MHVLEHIRLNLQKQEELHKWQVHSEGSIKLKLMVCHILLKGYLMKVTETLDEKL